MLKNTLILKLHPTRVAWYLNALEYGICKITLNLVYTGDILAERFGSIVKDNLNINRIAIEKPYLKLLGDQYSRKLAEQIIHTQRTFGVILYLIHLNFPGVPQVQVSSKVARDKIYNKEINKDIQLSEARVLLENTEHLSPLSLLCLHDCLCIERYLELENIVCSNVLLKGD